MQDGQRTGALRTLALVSGVYDLALALPMLFVAPQLAAAMGAPPPVPLINAQLNGQAIRSCVTPVSAVGTGKVVTLAGLGTPEKPHPIQAAYVEEQVPQCGYCINGWIMSAAALLQQNKKPTDAQIKDALTGLKCRCGTHMGIMRAVKRASEMMG